jgi:hypothetical protein
VYDEGTRAYANGAFIMPSCLSNRGMLYSL